MQKGNPFKVYMVGPSFKTQGGISSVLKIYKEHYEESLNLGFVASYSGKNRLWDLCFFITAWIKVLFLCIQRKPMLFHIHMASKGSFLRKSILAGLCRRFGKKVVLHIHGAMFDRFIESADEGKRRKIIRLLNEADKVIVLSRSWKDYFSKYLPAERILVIYNPSSTYNGAYPERNSSAARILFMGRMGQRKGTYDLLEAAVQMKNRLFTMTLYGDGETDQVRKKAEDLGLKDCVSVNSWVPHSEIEGMYEKSDIQVLPSYAEGLPMSVLEAMGKGLPVVTTCVGGIPEAVSDGDNGYLIQPGDVKALAESLDLLVGDGRLRERMGKRSLEITKEKFSVERIGEQLKELYTGLADPGEGGR